MIFSYDLLPFSIHVPNVVLFIIKVSIPWNLSISKSWIVIGRFLKDEILNNLTPSSHVLLNFFIIVSFSCDWLNIDISSQLLIAFIGWMGGLNGRMKLFMLYKILIMRH